MIYNMEDSRREKLRQFLSKAPKPQLHLHLDGSLSYPFVMQSVARLIETNRDLSRQQLFFDIDVEPKNRDELRHWLMSLKKRQFADNSVVKKNTNWEVFDFCNQFLQTREGLYSATYEIVTGLFKDHNVNYIEIRFAPCLHTEKELTQGQAVLAVVDGFRSAVAELTDSGKPLVAGGIILCALRSFPPSKAFEIVDLCKQTESVVGFDIAGDEGTYPLSLFSEVIDYAVSCGVKVTVHAGEWNEVQHPSSLDNIQLAVDLKVDRIGHGLALRSAGKHLLGQLKERQTPIEICLTSN